MESNGDGVRMLRKYDSLLNVEATIAKELFDRVDYPWEVLPLLREYILSLIPKLDDSYEEIGDNVYVHRDAKIASSACIVGPTIICKGAEIRHAAYIRGSVIVGENTIVGNSTEVKNAIIFNNVQCPHFNYVGDSVLGEHSHTGAGVVLSNVKSDYSSIIVKDGDEKIDTGLCSFGAILGDYVEVGCNSVIFPGSVVGAHTTIYPLTKVRGVIGNNKIVKDSNIIIDKR